MSRQPFFVGLPALLLGVLLQLAVPHFSPAQDLTIRGFDGYAERRCHYCPRPSGYAIRWEIEGAPWATVFVTFDLPAIVGPIRLAYTSGSATMTDQMSGSRTQFDPTIPTGVGLDSSGRSTISLYPFWTIESGARYDSVYIVPFQCTVKSMSGGMEAFASANFIFDFEPIAPIFDTPPGFALGNYPNPFNPSTTIEFALAEGSDVTLTIYNLLGKEVETLIDGRKEANRHTIVWDASAFPSGLYVCRIIARQPVTGNSPYTASTKLMLMR